MGVRKVWFRAWYRRNRSRFVHSGSYLADEYAPHASYNLGGEVHYWSFPNVFYTDGPPDRRKEIRI